MTEPIDPALLSRFHLTAFRDHLSLEAGHSDHTIVAYQRDLRRLVEFLVTRGFGNRSGSPPPISATSSSC